MIDISQKHVHGSVMGLKDNAFHFHDFYSETTGDLRVLKGVTP